MMERPIDGKAEQEAALEIKHTLMGDRREYPCRAFLLEPPSRAILFYVSTDGWRHEQPTIQIPPGALTFAYYWRDRPYNIYHWLNPDGATIGYYFNVADQTSIHPWGVEWNDLELDFWLDADGRGVVLDEEELPVTLAPRLARLVARVRDELVAHAAALAAEIQPQTLIYLGAVQRRMR